MGYGGLHMLYKHINRPSKYIFLLCSLLLEQVEEKYLLIRFKSSKLHDINKWQSARQEI